MLFFSSGDNKQKLMALYLLRAAKQPLSREQLITAMVELGSDDYFKVAEQLLTLEQNKYIVAVPVFNRQMMAATSLGEEAVSIFDNTLPKSLRESIDAYIESHRKEYHLENTSRVESEVQPDGSVNMMLALIEAGEAIFELRFKLPNLKYERIAERNWNDVSAELYLNTIMKLTDEKPKDEKPKEEKEKQEGTQNRKDGQ